MVYASLHFDFLLSRTVSETGDDELQAEKKRGF